MNSLKPETFMLIAGEASGDLLAAELTAELRRARPDAAFFGAGGNRMAEAGVEVLADMSRFSVVGITDVLLRLFELRELMQKLLAAAIKRQPDVVIGIDYGGFNLRFGHAVKEYVRNNPFSTWKPKIVQFVSPQVWASRPGRAHRLAADYDLLLSIFPFEKAWYAQRVPKLTVEFVGHPMVGRFSAEALPSAESPSSRAVTPAHPPEVLLLPGSRKSEIKRHLPPMVGALKIIQQKFPALHARMILPTEAMRGTAAGWVPPGVPIDLQIGGLPQALREADVAIAKTGTVTMECAFFGVPAVTLYKGSWLNYQIARHFITVKTFTMPNLLAGEEVYPEFLQNALTAENVAGAALDLLQNEARRLKMKSQLRNIIASLGPPGAPRRAAEAILGLLV
jgi:lipid-A-disaccharide synthase